MTGKEADPNEIRRRARERPPESEAAERAERDSRRRPVHERVQPKQPQARRGDSRYASEIDVIRSRAAESGAFRSPEAAAAYAEKAYAVYEAEYPRGNDLYLSTVRDGLDATLQVFESVRFRRPERAWAAVTGALPLVDESSMFKIMSSNVTTLTKFVQPLLSASKDPDDMLARAVEFMRYPFNEAGSGTFVYHNFDVFGWESRGVNPAGMAEELLRVTEPDVARVLASAVSRPLREGERLGYGDPRRKEIRRQIDMVEWSYTNPRDFRLFLQRQGAVNEGRLPTPAEQIRQVIAAGDDVSFCMSPHTGLVLVGEALEGHEAIARNAGVNMEADYREYVKGMVFPRQRGRGLVHIDLLQLNFGNERELDYFVRNAARALVREGVDPEMAVEMPQTDGRAEHTLASLAADYGEPVKIGGPEGNPLWKKTRNNGVTIYKYGTDPGDQRLIGGNVVVHGDEIHTGDVSFGILGGGVDTSCYCGASTREDGTIVLSGRVPKHGSKAPSPQEVKAMLVRYGYPKGKVIAEPITGKIIG